MKKFVSVMLVMMLVLGCFAACGSKKPAGTSANVPGSSLEVLETVWGLYGDDEKFPIYGGNPKENYEETVMDKPAVYDLADENISFNLLIPADQVANVDDVASMTHAMMANNFNAAVYHLTDGTDVQAFCETMYQAVSGNMWICGMPDRVIVAAISTEYVLVVYGVNDAINPFEQHFGTAYPDAVIAYNESLV